MRTIALFAYLFTSQFTFSQVTHLPSSEPQKLDITKYTVQDRKSFYPFNKATQIKLVSFGEQYDSSNVSHRAKFELPKLNDTICTVRLDQIKELSWEQVDTLTDIFYNTCSRWTIIERTEMGCYLPRNAIIFFDKQNKPFEYIEVCFECHGIKYSNKEVVGTEACDLMYKDLQSFFRIHGLKTSATELLRNNSR
jgi:hypothetical protein